MKKQQMVGFSIRLYREEVDALLHLANVESIHQKKNVRAADLIRRALRDAFPLQGFNQQPSAPVVGGVVKQEVGGEASAGVGQQ
jgi:hypothetical protein